MITNFFIPELNNRDVQELWFQQDGATCHIACATINLLKDTFGDRLISRFGPVNWPPRSCDLTPLDYFLWGYVKSLVYADKPQTLDHLEDNIRRVIADILPQMLEKVIENWTSRLDYIRASRGSPMPEIIFQMYTSFYTSKKTPFIFCFWVILNRVPLRMDFTEINSRGGVGRVIGRIDRQNSRFRTAKTTIIKFGLHASFVELESAKSALNEVLMIKICSVRFTLEI
ncbi:putative DD41D transposase [Trichonephila clavipes]|nr:putative DD41D transposase [Trichonephila clavipes]